MVAVRPAGARTIDEILASARARLTRLMPREAFGETAAGGVLIDIRPAAQRAERLPWVAGYDHRIIVFCVDGYTSSLAAAALQDLGLHRATDMIGGFRAWTEEGLPWAAAGAAEVTLAPGAAPALAPAPG
jgi:rhodanese-related sulfurtransferase